VSPGKSFCSHGTHISFISRGRVTVTGNHLNLNLSNKTETHSKVELICQPFFCSAVEGIYHLSKLFFGGESEASAKDTYCSNHRDRCAAFENASMNGRLNLSEEWPFLKSISQFG